MLVVAAHCPVFGVNVYTVDPTAEVFITAGDQVPAIGVEFVEINGRFPGIAFSQNGPNWVNVGVTGAVMATDMVVVVPHCPGLGVKV